MRDQIFLVHADASVADRQGFFVFIELQVDPRIKGERFISLVGKRQMPQFVERIRGIRNEFSQKDLRMRIERMNNELEKLTDFCLEFTFRHGCLYQYKRRPNQGAAHTLVQSSGMFKFALPILLGCLFTHSAGAQAIRFDATRKIWLLNTTESSYAMGIGADGELQHLYWGGPLWRLEDVPPAKMQHDLSSFDPHEELENEEFPGWGGKRYYEPALRVTRADGNRDLVLHYVTHAVHGDQLDITLKDIKDDISAVLHYRVYRDVGIISRWATIRNGTPQVVTLESAQSASWYMPPG